MSDYDESTSDSSFERYLSNNFAPCSEDELDTEMLRVSSYPHVTEDNNSSNSDMISLYTDKPEIELVEIENNLFFDGPEIDSPIKDLTSNNMNEFNDELSQFNWKIMQSILTLPTFETYNNIDLDDLIPSIPKEEAIYNTSCENDDSTTSETWSSAGTSKIGLNSYHNIVRNTDEPFVDYSEEDNCFRDNMKTTEDSVEFFERISFNDKTKPNKISVENDKRINDNDNTNTNKISVKNSGRISFNNKTKPNKIYVENDERLNNNDNTNTNKISVKNFERIRFNDKMKPNKLFVENVQWTNLNGNTKSTKDFVENVEITNFNDNTKNNKISVNNIGKIKFNHSSNTNKIYVENVERNDIKDNTNINKISVENVEMTNFKDNTNINKTSVENFEITNFNDNTKNNKTSDNNIGKIKYSIYKPKKKNSVRNEI